MSETVSSVDSSLRAEAERIIECMSAQVDCTLSKYDPIRYDVKLHLANALHCLDPDRPPERFRVPEDAQDARFVASVFVQFAHACIQAALQDPTERAGASGALKHVAETLEAVRLRSIPPE